jgi:hypothetical protein
MRHIFYLPHDHLGDSQRWYLERFLKQSEELEIAYQLKESYRLWFEQAKKAGADKLFNLN